MDTKAIALTIVFTALAIALTTFGVPAVFLANFYFRFWEIPIVAAFLLLSPKIGVTVAVLRTLAEMTLWPGPAGVFGPLVALPCTLSMLLGIYLADWLLKRKTSQDKNFGIKQVTCFTALGGLFRAATASLMMSAMFYFLFNRPGAEVMALVPLFAVFALILSLYTIPVGYLIARIVSRNLNVGNKL